MNMYVLYISRKKNSDSFMPLTIQIDHFFFALLGGSSKFIVYPLDTVKKRLQAQAFNTFWGTSAEKAGSAASSVVSKAEYNSLVDCAMKIARDEGIGAFYRGLAPSVLKTMGATGLTFAIFTFTKNTLETTHDWYCVKAKTKIRDDKR